MDLARVPSPCSHWHSTLTPLEAPTAVCECGSSPHLLEWPSLAESGRSQRTRTSTGLLLRRSDSNADGSWATSVSPRSELSRRPDPALLIIPSQPASRRAAIAEPPCHHSIHRSDLFRIRIPHRCASALRADSRRPAATPDLLRSAFSPCHRIPMSALRASVCWLLRCARLNPTDW